MKLFGALPVRANPIKAIRLNQMICTVQNIHIYELCTNTNKLMSKCTNLGLGSGNNSMHPSDDLTQHSME
jgi:hypothetical protein